MGKAGAVTPWSEWRPVAGLPAPMRADVLVELLDGGQAFRLDGGHAGVAQAIEVGQDFRRQLQGAEFGFVHNDLALGCVGKARSVAARAC